MGWNAKKGSSPTVSTWTPVMNTSNWLGNSNSEYTYIAPNTVFVRGSLDATSPTPGDIGAWVIVPPVSPVLPATGQHHIVGRWYFYRAGAGFPSAGVFGNVAINDAGSLVFWYYQNSTDATSGLMPTDSFKAFVLVMGSSQPSFIDFNATYEVQT